MTLTAGTRIGRYEIRSLLGAGGMGEVYRALDAELSREVALKVLPREVGSDTTRMERFIQEARATSALNHPNIVTVYDIGRTEEGLRFFAAELVPGETLRQQLQLGPMTLETALDIALQVANALVAAHAHGVVHRDLKPENIMIRPDGYVKVLDFGLAKLTSGAGQTEAATRAVNTDPGAVVGTVAYMSPEQARGENVDARTDIWSLGVVLFEMLTGVRPFDGRSSSHTTVAILDEEAPPLSRYLPDPPEALQEIVTDALSKDAETRFQNAKQIAVKLRRLKRRLEAGADLDAQHGSTPTHDSDALPESVTAAGAPVRAWPASGPEPAPRTALRPAASAEGDDAPTGVTKRSWSVVVALAVLGVALAAAAVMVYNGRARRSGPARDTGVRIVPFTTSDGAERTPAFSPDGRQLAYTWAGPHGNFDIFVQIIGAGEPLRLTRYPGKDTSPAWSPDGRYVAFLRGDGDEKGFYIVPALGGAARKITGAYGWNSRGVMAQSVDWSRDGTTLAIVDKAEENDPWTIWWVSVDTGERRRAMPVSTNQTEDVLVTFSPDGRSLAFARRRNKTGPYNSLASVYIVSSLGGEPVRVTSDQHIIGGLAWTPDGQQILFSSTGFAGESVLRRVAASGGESLPLTLPTSNMGDFAVSRADGRLAFSTMVIDHNIWRIDLRQAVQAPGRNVLPTRLLASTRMERSPQFSPNGQRVAFWSDRSGAPELWVSDANGNNAVQLTALGSTSGTTVQTYYGAPAWSPDGASIAFDFSAGPNMDIALVDARGGRVRRLTDHPSLDALPSWSRNGRWIYFSSERSGRVEVWRMSANGESQQPLTHEGGWSAVEAVDGTAVFFVRAADRFAAVNAGIWRMNLDGSAQEQVIAPPLPQHREAVAIQVGDWMPAQRGIYYFVEYSIDSGLAMRYVLNYFEFVTRRATVLATVEGGPGLMIPTMSVSPDEQAVIYEQRDRLESDLLLLENFR